MFLRLIVITFLFCPTLSWAQGVSGGDDKPKMSDEEVDQRLGKNIKGIIYICNPYCEFVSIREEKSWNPPLEKTAADWAHTKLILQTDPLYPLLVSRNPVFPFTNKKLPQTKTADETTKVSPPKYAVYNFNWGYAVAGGFLYSQSTWSGNTELQQDLSSNGIQYMPFVQFQLMKGSPTKLWKFWLQHEIDLAYGTSPGYKAKDINLAVSNTQYTFSYQIWAAFEKFKIGPRLSYDSESWNVSSNSLQHFSFDRQAYLLGLYSQWNHWQLALDTSLMAKISEAQAFRKDPFTLNWYRLKLQKCTNDITLFDITFGACGGGMVLLDQQKAGLADNILLSETSTMNRTDYGLYFLIRIGEDLY